MDGFRENARLFNRRLRRFFKGWDATPPGSWDVGAGRYPGSLTPDYRMGMLRIPQECASCGCGGKGDAEI